MAGPIHRAFWISVGATSVGLGVVGIVLPLLPTTPFLLLAAFCFARGSDGLHRWLVEHARLGPPIEAWRQYGAISRSAKWTATALLGGMLVLSVAMRMPEWVIAVQAIVAVAVGYFLWSRPLPP